MEGRLLVEERLGNWGWLDCGGNGTPGLVDAILNGCDLDLTLTGTPPTITVDGQPGNKINAGPIRDALDAVKGQVVALPVYDKLPARARAPSTAWSASST